MDLSELVSLGIAVLGLGGLVFSALRFPARRHHRDRQPAGHDHD